MGRSSSRGLLLAPGLVVDDAQAAVGQPLEPVHPAAHDRAAEGHLQGELGADLTQPLGRRARSSGPAARPWRAPRRACGRRPTRTAARGGPTERRPAAAGRRLVGVTEVGGDVVDEGPDVGGADRRAVAAAGAEQPAQAALPELLDLAGRDPHRLAVRPQRPVVAELAQRPPAPGVGAGDASRASGPAPPRLGPRRWRSSETASRRSWATREGRVIARRTSVKVRMPSSRRAAGRRCRGRPTAARRRCARRSPAPARWPG